ncbi:uncharacterized protein isoform X2 [Rhodnius prolixus]|uniref:uncharacterized protein isoform X2 n=1 Tax=Rhodnius prolixus TaxID=13249 RepID=UPI003D189E32
MEKPELNKITKRSSIWLYFSRDHNKRDLAQCCICGIVISTRGGSTSNLCRHIRAKHKIKFRKRQVKKHSYARQQIVTDCIQSSEQGMIYLEGIDGERIPAKIIVPQEIEMDMDNRNVSVGADCVTVWGDTELDEAATSNKTFLQRSESISGVNDVKKHFLLKRKSNGQSSNKKVEALFLIAHSLGRMASALEIIADCFRQRNPRMQKNVEVISKLNEILQILQKNDTQDEKQSTNDVLDVICDTTTKLRNITFILKTMKCPWTYYCSWSP